MSGREGIARALARIPSGLFILTVGRGEDATGMLSSFVQQVGFDPPALVVAIRKGRHLEDRLRAEGAFCLSVLDEGSRSLLAHFARGFDPGEPAFRGIELDHTGHGVPYPRAAHAHLECEVIGEADWSDHLVFCGKVVNGACRREDPPLVHIRKNGFSY